MPERTAGPCEIGRGCQRRLAAGENASACLFLLSQAGFDELLATGPSSEELEAIYEGRF